MDTEKRKYYHPRVPRCVIGTTREWAKNPLLYKGFIGAEITPNRRIMIKIGDGKNRWKDLKYCSNYNPVALLKALYENTDLQKLLNEAKPVQINPLVEVLVMEIAACQAFVAVLSEWFKNERAARQTAEAALQEALGANKEE